MLSPDEIKLHAALLAYWEKFKVAQHPYVNETGTQMVKLNNAQGESAVSIKNETYYRLHMLGTDIEAMSHEKNLHVPKRETLDRLMQFFNDTGCCKISFNPMELPILCRNIETMEGYVVELKELSSFQENKKDYLHMRDCVTLPVLSASINALANDAKKINAENLSREAKTIVTQLQKMNTRDSYRQKEVKFYMSAVLRILFVISCVFFNVIKTTFGIPAASYVLNYLSKAKIESYHPIIWPFFVICMFLLFIDTLKLKLRSPVVSFFFRNPHALLTFVAINPYEMRLFDRDFSTGPITFYMTYCLLVILTILATMIEMGAANEASFMNQRHGMHLVIRERSTGEELAMDILFMEDGRVRVEHETPEGNTQFFIIERGDLGNHHEFINSIRTQAVLRFSQPAARAPQSPVDDELDPGYRHTL